MAAPVSANTAATTALEAADAACTVSDGGQGVGAYLQPWRRSVDVLEGMRWRRPLAATSSWQPQQRPRLALLAPRTRTHTGVLGDRQRAVGRSHPRRVRRGRARLRKRPLRGPPPAAPRQGVRGQAATGAARAPRRPSTRRTTPTTARRWRQELTTPGWGVEDRRGSAGSGAPQVRGDHIAGGHAVGQHRDAEGEWRPQRYGRRRGRPAAGCGRPRPPTTLRPFTLVW